MQYSRQFQFLLLFLYTNTHAHTRDRVNTHSVVCDSVCMCLSVCLYLGLIVCGHVYKTERPTNAHTLKGPLRVESRSVLDQNTSWVIVEIPPEKILLEQIV